MYSTFKMCYTNFIKFYKDLGSAIIFLSHFKISVFYFNIFQNVIYSCDDKAEFSGCVTGSS